MSVIMVLPTSYKRTVRCNGRLHKCVIPTETLQLRGGEILVGDSVGASVEMIQLE